MASVGRERSGTYQPLQGAPRDLVSQAMIDAVNPRLSKYRHALCLATIIIILQCLSVAAVTYGYIFRSYRLKPVTVDAEVILDLVDADSKICYIRQEAVTSCAFNQAQLNVFASMKNSKLEDLKSHPLGEKVVVAIASIWSQKDDISADYTCTLPQGTIVTVNRSENVESIDRIRGFITVERMPPFKDPALEHFTACNESQQGWISLANTEDNNMWVAKKSYVDPMKVYDCLGMSVTHPTASYAFDYMVPCNVRDVARVVVAKRMPWDQAIPNAFALVGNIEIAVTCLVLIVHLTIRKGPCWCRDPDMQTEFVRTATEAISSIELERQRQGA